MITSPAFAGKKYAVLGLARSGLATVEALVASDAEVLAWDSREEARQAVAGRVTLSDPLSADLSGYAGIVVSPGVPLNRHPIAAKGRESGVPIIGDIELFAQARPSLPRHKVIGITGTNGKSTTTALVAHIVRTAGLPVTMAGNIGYPILGQEPLANDGIYVLELSSYQIDLTHSLDCDVAALLNVSPDHLDRYDGVDAYAQAKARLFEMQSPDRVAVVATDDHFTRRAASSISSRLISVSSSDVADQSLWPSLQGPHNAQNVAAARAIAAVHWIVGGLPKGEDLGPCVRQLDHVRAAYTIGEAGPMFARLLEGKVPVRQCELLIEAVQSASRAAVAGEVVLLSPACASFDQFRDYEARGDAFRAAVEALA
jgi:UDP-N-acetylmuramoylalanine--D-glutamate ligase